MSPALDGRWPVVAVIGGAEAGEGALDAARAVGRAAISSGCALVTGGRGGVMAAASQGARQARGQALAPPVIAVLPTYRHSQANPWADLVLPTGLGHARNAIVVASADLVVAIGGAAGTLSEVGLACKLGRPVLLVKGTGGVSGRLAGVLPVPGLQPLSLDQVRDRIAGLSRG